MWAQWAVWRRRGGSPVQARRAGEQVDRGRRLLVQTLPLPLRVPQLLTVTTDPGTPQGRNRLQCPVEPLGYLTWPRPRDNRVRSFTTGNTLRSYEKNPGDTRGTRLVRDAEWWCIDILHVETTYTQTHVCVCCYHGTCLSTSSSTFQQDQSGSIQHIYFVLGEPLI